MKIFSSTNQASTFSSLVNIITIAFEATKGSERLLSQMVSALSDQEVQLINKDLSSKSKLTKSQSSLLFTIKAEIGKRNLTASTMSVANIKDSLITLITMVFDATKGSERLLSQMVSTLSDSEVQSINKDLSSQSKLTKSQSSLLFTIKAELGKRNLTASKGKVNTTARPIVWTVDIHCKKNQKELSKLEEDIEYAVKDATDEIYEVISIDSIHDQGHILVQGDEHGAKPDLNAIKSLLEKRLNLGIISIRCYSNK